MYVFRTNALSENVRRAFLDYLREIHSLVRQPHFYSSSNWSALFPKPRNSAVGSGCGRASGCARATPSKTSITSSVVAGSLALVTFFSGPGARLGLHVTQGSSDDAIRVEA